MTRGKTFFLGISAVLAVCLVAGGWLAAQTANTPAGESIYKFLSVFSEAFGQIRQSYVDETEGEELLAAAFDGVSDALDAFSLYVPPEGVERHGAARAVGSARSGVILLKERGVPYVVSVDPTGAAATAGLEAGDLVAEIDGRPTRTIPLWEMRALLAQAPGTAIRLQLLRRGEPQEATLTLREVGAGAPTLGEQGGVPILRLSAFDASTAKEVDRILRQLAKAKPAASKDGPVAPRLIVDLRGTGRGEAAHAYAVAGLFHDGDLGATMTRGVEEQGFRGAPPLWSGNLVVLVDRSTLGPAEVLATVLRQTVAARVVGERTFGYAGRQKVVSLPSGGAIELTDAFYTGPDRKRLERGLRPDVLVDERSRTFAERDVPIEQLILERALEVVRQEPVAPARAA